jgi:diaminohydroxyphosphoribosylaminopyrimidine deaminase/5-amino-6-(5-phosphoribosylamino)uracil reductase
MALAAFGKGSVSPNPLVGSVIVYHDRIIGEGWHQQYGHAHAEVNAVADVKDKSLLAESTVYVNLEPCSHFGKTPPCADMLIQHKVKRVVIANVDTNPLVGGKGIQKLREAGIVVDTGVLAEEGRILNRRFFSFVEKRRPYIILKWAQTRDGFIARTNHDSKWISNEFSRQLVHQWRAEEDSILVGPGTAMFDNPRLTVRDWTGRNPVRIVIDRYLRLDQSLHVFDQSVQTLCYNVLRHEQKDNTLMVRIEEKNFIENLVQDLYERKIQSVIVEGGAAIIQAFVNEKLWDEARVFTGQATFEEGIAAPVLPGELVEETRMTGDKLSVFRAISRQA